MSLIERLEFKNKIKGSNEFEIHDLQNFFRSRPLDHLTRNYRLDFWVLIYVTEGEGYHHIDFEKYGIASGDLIIMQKHQVQHFEVNEKLQGFILIFNESFIYNGEEMSSEVFFKFFNQSYKSPVLSIDNAIGTVNRTIIELIYATFNTKDKKINERLIRSLFHSFILSLRDFYKDKQEEYNTSYFRIYTQFRKLIEENYITKKTVEDYVKLMHVSRKSINQSTRAIVGLSAKELIVGRIILEIKRYIGQGELKTFEISNLMGFDEPSNMTKFFKRYTGESPASFKEALKKTDD